MPRKKPGYLTIVGNIGGGKTTASKTIAKGLGIPLINADNLFQTRNPFKDEYLKEIERWSFINELWLFRERAKLIEKRTNGHSLTLIDSGLLMSWAFVYNHKASGKITAREWKFLEELFHDYAADFMKKTLVLRLDYPVKTLLARIKERAKEEKNRKFELKYYDDYYLSGIDKGLRNLDKKLTAKKVPVLRIKEEDIPEFRTSKEGQEKLLEKTREFLKENGVLT